MVHFGVISAIPEILASLQWGITGRAQAQNIVKITSWNIRDWGLGSYQRIDDKPYGGGPGMVLMYEPLSAAIQHAKGIMPDNCRTIFLSPQGRTIQQKDLQQVVKNKQSLLFIAGRYEGIDERIVQDFVDEEWSIGDFVLSGGELAAMVFIDAMVRLLPGSLGHVDSAQQDSFMEGLFDHPHYTKPPEINGRSVPEVLLSGNHQAIALWRRQQALGITWLKRPELLETVLLSDLDKQLLIEFQQGVGQQTPFEEE